jgi:hypothetical protein
VNNNNNNNNNVGHCLVSDTYECFMHTAVREVALLLLAG